MQTYLSTCLKTGLQEKASAGFTPNKYNWTKPPSWPEIRHITPSGGIGLLFCDAFPLLSFRVICQGGYKVLLDGEEYASYANNTLCSITIANIQSPGTLTDYPAPYTLHTAVIVPTIGSAEIKSFKCDRSGASGTEQQGILWAHSAIEGTLDSFSVSAEIGSYKVSNDMIKALTVNGAEIKIKSIYSAFNECSELEYIPTINYMGNSSKNYCTFRLCKKLKKVVLKNLKPSDIMHMFYKAEGMEIIKWGNADFSVLTHANESLVEVYNLQTPLLDFSSATALTKLDCYGSQAKPMRGLRGLVVSPNAPFTNTSAPQINIKYTGLNRQGLIVLFESLPQVSKGQKINISYTNGAADLTEEDLNIAINKGWEVMA